MCYQHLVVVNGYIINWHKHWWSGLCVCYVGVSLCAINTLVEICVVVIIVWVYYVGVSVK